MIKPVLIHRILLLHITPTFCPKSSQSNHLCLNLFLSKHRRTESKYGYQSGVKCTQHYTQSTPRNTLTNSEPCISPLPNDLLTDPQCEFCATLSRCKRGTVRDSTTGHNQGGEGQFFCVKKNLADRIVRVFSI